MHPDALGWYQHPEGRPHALMFPLIYLLQQFLMTDGTSEEVWRPQYRDGDGGSLGVPGSFHYSDEEDVGSIEGIHLQSTWSQHERFVFEAVSALKSSNVGNMLNCEFG
eukprot:5547407-Amphidinium_carterae.2